METYIGKTNRAQDKFKIIGNDFDLSRNGFTGTPAYPSGIYGKNTFDKNGIRHFPSIIQEILDDIADIHAGNIITFFPKCKANIYNSLRDVLFNSFDACKDNFLKNPEFIGEITINIIINTKRKVVTIIIKDNGAGINASNTDEKRFNPEFLGGAGVGKENIKKESDKYKPNINTNGATTILQFR